MHIVVLIPSYKERENLEKLIPTLYTKIYPQLPTILFSTLVVDDNSPDGTRSLCDIFVRTYPHFYTSYGDKHGIGAAMKRGYQFALNNLHSDAVVTYEADFVFEPETILDLVDALNGGDVILASRINESEFYQSSQIRRIAHFLANTAIAGWIGGLSVIREHTAAGRAIKVKGVLDAIELHTLPNGYSFFPAILYALAHRTDKFIELRIEFRDRRVGTSKMEFSTALQELRTSLVHALRHRFSK